METTTNNEWASRLADHELLESVIKTDELRIRPSRPPDYASENRALVYLALELAASPGTILQKLAETTLDACQAGSAGVSLLSNEDGGNSFYWPAVAGAWSAQVGGGTPRKFGPCGIVLDRDATQLFSHPERFYPYLEPVTPAIEEVLLVPFYVEEKAVGTVWAVSHDKERRFDREDERILGTLAKFASAAYQSLDSVKVLQALNVELKDARRAALSIMEDAVGARQQAEQSSNALREEEERFRMLADNMSQLAWTCDMLGNVTWYNQRWYDYTGTTFEEMKDWGWKMVQHPDHIDRVVASVQHSRETGDVWEDTFPLRAKNGEYHWFLSRAVPIRDENGNIIRWFGTNTDITQQREAEQALQDAHDKLESLVQRRTASLRRLSRHLQHVQDEERRRIARDLHDSAGQYLAALKMNLAQLNHADPKKAEAVLAESNQLLDTCLAEIRTISYLLHPPMLDESGLASAASWYVEGFAKRSSIKANLEISPRLERLPRDAEMVLFRALQESLTNVHRHSQSSKVDVRLETENGHAVLLVRDYGRGFPPERLESFRGGSDLGVGTAGMRERVIELGGVLEVFSEKPGTSVKVTLPIAKAEARTAQPMEGSANRGSAA